MRMLPAAAHEFRDFAQGQHMAAAIASESVFSTRNGLCSLRNTPRESMDATGESA